MSAHPAALALALRVVDAAARLAPATERAGLRGEWRAELWHRTQRLQREGRWTAAAAAALLLRSLGSVPDALDLRLCGPDGAADPWAEGARAGRRLAGHSAALLCAALAIAVAAFTCALASTLLAGGAPPAWTRIDGGARAFILGVAALWSVALVGGSILAAQRLSPTPSSALLAASGLLGLCLALLGATRAASAAAPASILATADLPLRAALAWLAVWSTSVLAFSTLHRRPHARSPHTK
ncbi:MAG TPA: hypothetical protein VF613_16920 [Longimicrobium sp.]